MPLPPSNPWYEIVIPQLRAGRITAADAAWMVGVSRERIGQWCFAAGFNAIDAHRDVVVQLYARGLIRIAREERVRERVAFKMKAKARAKKPRKPMSKKALRAMAGDKVISFVEAGGKIKRIPKGKRGHVKPL